SREYGRQYIDLTRKYVDRFKNGWTPPPIDGPYRNAREVSVELGGNNQERGLKQLEHDDGRTEPGMRAQTNCRVADTSRGGHYMYFAIDESFKSASGIAVDVEVAFFDEGAGSLSVDYDSNDVQAPLDGAYPRAPDSVRLNGTNSWRTARFRLEGARFSNAQNGGADFRLAVEGKSLAVAKVRVVRNSNGSDKKP